MRKCGLFLVLMVGGCMHYHGVRPLKPLEIPTAPYHQLATTALTGSLTYEGGCLLFRDEASGAIMLPVWPVGSMFNGTAVLFHEPAKSDQRVLITEEFLMSGQPLQWETLGTAPYQPFQSQCGAFQPFFVTGVRPAN